jgi:hypothetical protein
MKRIIIIIITLALAYPSLLAQNLVDALRYSQTFNGGTARFVSMGGAFGALGGDFSSLSDNPAGIGVFLKSEFSISPSLDYNKTRSTFLSNEKEDFSYDFNIGQVGFVGTLKSGNGNWKNLNFAVGYNSLNNYNQLVPIEGTRPDTDNRLGISMFDYFMYNDYVGGNLDGTDPNDLDPYWERLAFDAYVIDTIPGTNFDYDDGLLPVGATQKQTIENSGRNNEWLFAFGGNYNHKLYFGASLGIRSIRYNTNIDHTENWVEGANPYYFTFRQDITTRGTGYTFKMGAIFKPIDLLRIGASLHLPTFYSMEDEYYNTMESSFVNYVVTPTNQDGDEIGSDIVSYKLITPLKFIGSVGLQFQKLGMLSFDYEYVDYTAMRFRNRESGTDFDTDNQMIEDTYKPVSNLRAGAEIKLGSFALRGGYAHFGSPYKKGTENEKADYSNLSAGIGLREKNFSFDLGYVHSLHEERYHLYEMEPDGAFMNSNNDQFIATLGIRF